MRTDDMIFTAFVSATVTRSGVGAWTHAAADLGILTRDYYVSLAQTLERTGFDFIFFDDRLAMPAAYERSFRKTVARGSKPIKLDLLTLLGLIAGHTSRIGLGGTYSTTYSVPFYVARAFATLDHISGGRAIWNVVTSRNAEEAANIGVEFRVADDRYDRADEYLEIATALWGSWEEGALLMDRESGRFADPDRVHAIDYDGRYLFSRGPLPVPRTPQGWPTLLQAGMSDRGQRFAAKWADLVFTSHHDAESARSQYSRQKQLVVDSGRDPEKFKILPAILPVVGETTAIAKEKAAYLDTLADPEEPLIFLSEQANFDFGELPLDEALSDDFLASVAGIRGSVLGYIEGARAEFGPEATLREVALEKARKSGTRFVGSAGEVADRLEEWFDAHACDGFAITATHVPGGFEDFGRLVLPELRRRGRIPEAPATGPFRQRMGLEPR